MLELPNSSWRFGSLAALGLLLGLRELRILRFPIPQMPRQTAKQWRHRMGPIAAAFAWGADLGSGITTYIRYGGFWLLPASAVLSESVTVGAVLIGAFGIARGLTIANASYLLRRRPSPTAHLPDLMRDVKWIRHQEPTVRRLHGTSVVLVSANIIVLSVLGIAN